MHIGDVCRNFSWVKSVTREGCQIDEQSLPFSDSGMPLTTKPFPHIQLEILGRKKFYTNLMEAQWVCKKLQPVLLLSLKFF
jgi:hypothetical protein